MLSDKLFFFLMINMMCVRNSDNANNLCYDD